MSYENQKKGKVIKKRKRRSAKISKISLLIFILSALIVFNFGILGSSLRGAISFGNVKIEKIYSYEFKSNLDYKSATIINSNTEYTIIKDEGILSYFDSNMELKWKKEINASDVIIESSGDLIVVANRLAGDIYTIDKDGKILGKQLSMGKIEEIIINSSDRFLVYFEEDGIASVLNKSATIECNILVPGYNVTNIDISSKHDVIAISLYKVENETVFSSIMTYSIDGKLTGIMNKEDQIIYDLDIVSDSIVVVTDKGISRYSFENEALFEDYLFERELSNFSIDKTGNVVANLIIESKDIADTRSDNVLVIVDTFGKVIKELELENTIQKITKYGLKTCYFADGKLYILDENGAVLGIQLIKENPVSIAWIDDSKIGILYNDSYDLFALN